MIKTPLRTNAMYAKYLKNKRAGLSHLPVIREFRFWRLVENEFPYDKIATRHDMLIPKRKISNIWSLSKLEVTELRSIWRHLEKTTTYDTVIAGFPKGITYPSHLHFHLIKIKEI